MIDVVAVDDALDKINNGTYGSCDVCGKEIAMDRLEARPFTTICRDCKEADEKIPHRDGRPAEEDILTMPFATNLRDDLASTLYDGEDAWQEVAHYSETPDEWSRGGSYYGYADFDNIPYEVGDDGVFYKDFRGVDDESAPMEKIDVGIEHTKED